jgi:F420-non-reducing hydrogenase iron-sulfur subunit
MPNGCAVTTNKGKGMTKDPAFQPEITVFSCIYCAYMAADTAGSLRQEYPANIKIIRLPCTGKTDTRYILEAFEKGADGVYIVACSLGNCHHERGNERGKARVERTKEILKNIGIEPERLEMFFLSGSMGATFANIAHQMTERIRALGPNPLKSSCEEIDEIESLPSK